MDTKKIKYLIERKELSVNNLKNRICFNPKREFKDLSQMIKRCFSINKEFKVQNQNIKNNGKKKENFNKQRENNHIVGIKHIIKFKKVMK